MDKVFVSGKDARRATVQLNTRISLRLRQQMDEYLQYMDRPYPGRLKRSKNWPISNTGIVQVALKEFLENHPQIDRPGPSPDPPPPAITAQPKPNKQTTKGKTSNG